MKNYTKTLLCFGMLLTVALIGCKNDSVTINLVPGKKFVILLVNTDDLQQGDEPKTYSSFAHQGWVSDKKFKTRVFPSDSVIWMGVSTSAPFDHIINIKEINPKSDKVLEAQKVENRMVRGKIAENAPKGKRERYTIHFTVIKDGTESDTYFLDPILRVH